MQENKESISVDAGFVLRSIAMIISQWLKHYILAHFDECTPPLLEVDPLVVEENTKVRINTGKKSTCE